MAETARVTDKPQDVEHQWRGHLPNRADTYRGVYLPPWILALGISTEAMVVWGAMAKLAGRKRRLRNHSVATIGSVIGLDPSTTRKAIRDLVKAGVIEQLSMPGRASDYAFRAPAAGAPSWSYHLYVAEAETDQPWREW